MKKYYYSLLVFVLLAIVFSDPVFLLQYSNNSLENESYVGIIQSRSFQIRPASLKENYNKTQSDMQKMNLTENAKKFNKSITQFGFDYEISDCEFSKKNKLLRQSEIGQGVYNVYLYQITDMSGKQIQAELFANSDNSGLCSECFLQIPCLSVSKEEITIVSNGSPVRIKRPKNFVLEEMSLVDETFKRTIRRWEIPTQSVPAGISEDQTKLYLYTQTDGLLLEVSEHTVAYKTEKQVKLPQKVEIKNPPTDKNNAYLSFEGFKHGDRVSIIRFTGPCT
ncbi:MAG: hypothetical protein K1Y36_28855 [Blastocatellia bacterium]|nr:hypothetical protein [Blastocatellia bacterium]